MEYLSKDAILLINKMTVDRHGGNYVPPLNLLNSSSLEYLIEAVQSSVFGQEANPEISEKAGLYMFNIISNHIFQDGNKRTGLEAALLFLRLNRFQLRSELKIYENKNGKSVPSEGSGSTEILFNFTMEVASGKLTLRDCQEWFALNMVAIK